VNESDIKEQFLAAVARPDPDRIDMAAVLRGGRRRHRIRVAATLGSTAVVLLAIVSVAFVGFPHLQSTPVDGTSPATSDAFITATFGVIGPSTRSPATLARVAHALDCVSFMAGLPNPGGPVWEVHLRVAEARVDTAITALKEIQGVSDVAVIPLSRYSASPTGSGSRLVQAQPC
jgi:hypothetical protein